MDAIKAFVGHSFAEGDADVIRSITELLKHIARIHPNFSWETAADPEPQLVAAKVLARFADKNLFIGICTNKERVIGDAALKPFWALRPKRFANAEEFAWKTSDWLIQEVGIAVGLGIKIILLMEEGVRRPGAIQGDLEFVTFRRGEPEKCAKDLMAMIANLSPPDAKLEQAPAAANTAAPEAAAAEPATPDGAWETPHPDWKQEDYDRALFFAIVGREDPIVEKITAAFIASPLGETEERRREWKAKVEFDRIAFGKGGDLNRLREIADGTPPIGSVLAQLARAYRKYGEHAHAFVAFERALAAEPDMPRKIQYLGEAAIEAQEAGPEHSAKVTEMLERIRQLGSDSPNAEKAVLMAEQGFAEKFSDKNVSLGLLERLLDLDPSNAGSRFKLAYQYGELGMANLALYHYTKIPPAERDGYVWNNLGVARGTLGIPGRAVVALRASEEQAETLAMANLANRFSEAGFLDEATALLKHAAGIADHHRNVDSALAQLKDTPEREEKKENELSEMAAPVSDFYRHFGRALGLPRPEQMGSLWASQQYGGLAASTSVDSVRFSGKYEVEGLLGTLFASAYGHSSQKTTYEIEFSGALYGRAVIAQVRRTKAGEASAPVSLLDDKTPTVLMWIHDDGKKISAMERQGNSEPHFYGLTRVI